MDHLIPICEKTREMAIAEMMKRSRGRRNAVMEADFQSENKKIIDVPVKGKIGYSNVVEGCMSYASHVPGKNMFSVTSDEFIVNYNVTFDINGSVLEG